MDFYITDEKNIALDSLFNPHILFYGRKCYPLVDALSVCGEEPLGDYCDKWIEIDCVSFMNLMDSIQDVIGLAYQIDALSKVYDTAVRTQLDAYLDTYTKWYDSVFNEEPNFGYTHSAHDIIAFWEAGQKIDYLLSLHKPVYVYFTFN